MRYLTLFHVVLAVTISVESRKVTVTGPRGSLSRDFKHVSIAAVPLGKHSIRFDMWFGNRLQLATIRTLTTHIENMIVGVTKGFCYRMRFAYAHFPINVTLTGTAGNQTVEIRNFLGQRRVRKIQLLPGVNIIKSSDVKDQLELTGNDIEVVSRSAALIHQSCLVRHKDIRKFLDGIYVSEKGPIGKVVAV
jgi:large subunit ribosomal protein L9e